jgi:hypothetical protein
MRTSVLKPSCFLSICNGGMKQPRNASSHSRVPASSSKTSLIDAGQFLAGFSWGASGKMKDLLDVASWGWDGSGICSWTVMFAGESVIFFLYFSKLILQRNWGINGKMLISFGFLDHV